MKKIALISITLFFVQFIFGQVYTQVNNIGVQQNNYVSINHNAGLFSIANSINSFRNSWENNKRRNREIEKTKRQLDFIRNRFNEVEKFPNKIIDGWHLVTVTDNYNYCKEAKVLIKENKIEKFVIDNYIALSLNFKMISKIKKAKCLVSLEVKKENFDNVEVYFVYDLDQPVVVDKPLNAGYVSFWSDMRNADHIKIWLNKKYLGELKNRIKTEPNYFDKATITLKLKPGSYNLKGEGRGKISWKEEIVIKENQGLKINLNKENKV